MTSEWKEEFFRIYFDDNADSKLKEEQLNIKNENIPEFLYQYQNTGHIDDILENNFMYLPEIGELNDPYEGNISYNMAINNFNKFTEIFDAYSQLYSNTDRRIKKEDYETLKKEISKSFEIMKKTLMENLQDFNETKFNRQFYLTMAHYPEIFKEHDEFLKENTSLICLTEDRNNNPMWAHYGDNHKGICIKYDFKNCCDFFKEYCFPVWYDNSSIIDNFQINKYKHVLQTLSFKPFMKKSKDWRCEKEWRIILDKTILKKESRKHFCICNKEYIEFLKPSAVYLGKDISEEDREKILGIYSEDIKVYQMKQSNKKYDLDEELIS